MAQKLGRAYLASLLFGSLIRCQLQLLSFEGLFRLDIPDGTLCGWRLMLAGGCLEAQLKQSLQHGRLCTRHLASLRVSVWTDQTHGLFRLILKSRAASLALYSTSCQQATKAISDSKEGNVEPSYLPNELGTWFKAAQFLTPWAHIYLSTNIPTGNKTVTAHNQHKKCAYTCNTQARACLNTHLYDFLRVIFCTFFPFQASHHIWGWFIKLNINNRAMKCLLFEL